MTQDEIIRMAREAGAVLDKLNYNTAFTIQELKRFAALVAAHEREKQAEQEPVAWQNKDKPSDIILAKDWDDDIDPIWHWMFKPLYAAPVRTKDLTDVDLWKLWEKSDSTVEFARAIIAADREKNK